MTDPDLIGTVSRCEPSSDEEVVTRAGTALFSRPALAAVTTLVLAAAVQWIPGLERVRVFSRPAAPEPTPAPLAAPDLSVGESELLLASESRRELAQPDDAQLRKAARGPIGGSRDEPELPAIDAKEPPVPLTGGEHLSGFYEALARTAQKKPGAITRITHFGDSVIASDYVSGTLRRKLQEQFGDAGHGFMLIANAWPAYFHNDVERWASPGWKVSRVVGPLAADGWYGLGGVTFSAPAGARARFGTASDGDFGRAVSRFVLAYVEQPGGGEIALALDGEEHERLSTDGPEKRVRYHEVSTTDGPHQLEVVTKTKQSRLLGVTMERDVPGVVLDAIGIQGARIRFLDKQDDAHWAEQLRQRASNLLVYQFGANESGDGFLYPMEDYYRTMKAVLLQGKAALPNASCLVIAPMDRAAKRGDQLITIKVIPHLVKQQRKVAAEVGCGYFDTYEAMGGKGSMATWVRRGLGQADLTHPSAVGAQVIGNWIYRALMQGYNAHLEARQRQR